MNLPVNETEGNPFLLRDSDRGQHLFSGIHSQIRANSPLETGQDKVTQEKKTLTVLQDLIDVEALPVALLGEGFVAGGIYLNADPVRSLFSDRRSDLVHALA